jgi:hypothetical protein
MTEEKVKQEVRRANRRETDLVLGSDKSRGYCLEMIGADLWAGQIWARRILRFSCSLPLRFFKFLPVEERQKFVHHVTEKAS